MYGRIFAGIVVAFLMIGIGATSPANAETNVSVDIRTIAVGSEVDSTSAALYFNPAHGDDTSNAYQLGYQGTLNMTNVWNTYANARSLYILSQVFKGNSYAEATERWQRFKLEGGFEIGFTVDPNRVTVDPSFITCDAVQAQYEAENPNSFSQLMTCQSVAFEMDAGRYVAKFEPKHTDGTSTTTKDLDEPGARPASLVLSTPSEALYVKQSDFEAGVSFDMVDAYVRGSLKPDLLFISQVPVVFNSNTASAVTLSMVDTYSTNYEFEPATGAPALPTAVSDLLPAPGVGARTGTVVTPQTPAETLVKTPEGIWEFVGWTPGSQTVADTDLTFVGTWSFQRAQTFKADFEFVSEQTDLTLPSSVLSSVPAPIDDLLGGAVVTPPVPAVTRVSNDAGTWEFVGWTPGSQTVADTDLTFVGTWKFSKTAGSAPSRLQTGELATTGMSTPMWASCTLAVLLLALGSSALIKSRHLRGRK